MNDVEIFRRTLYGLNYNDTKIACSSSKFHRSACNDVFWAQKMQNDYGFDVREMPNIGCINSNERKYSFVDKIRNGFVLNDESFFDKCKINDTNILYYFYYVFKLHFDIHIPYETIMILGDPSDQNMTSLLAVLLSSIYKENMNEMLLLLDVPENDMLYHEYIIAVLYCISMVSIYFRDSSNITTIIHYLVYNGFHNVNYMIEVVSGKQIKEVSEKLIELIYDVLATSININAVKSNIIKKYTDMIDEFLYTYNTDALIALHTRFNGITNGARNRIREVLSINSRYDELKRFNDAMKT